MNVNHVYLEDMSEVFIFFYKKVFEVCHAFFIVWKKFVGAFPFAKHFMQIGKLMDFSFHPKKNNYIVIKKHIAFWSLVV